ncbi:unnamed protein product [Rotaria sp. Silwood1]|nr:unnamed protein product [Rotaria sp. Silwood1]
MMTTTITTEISEIDHKVSSEQYRLQTFENLTYFPSITRRQLALAGFIYRNNKCVCPQCGVCINLEAIDEDCEYTSNYFRKLHRQKVSCLGKRCSFLLCESGTNIDDLHPPLSSQQQPQWDDAEEPEYMNYIARLQSFESWPASQEEINGTQETFVTPQTMAKHGFYFSGFNDSVTCFYCGNTLVDWSSAIHSTNPNIVELEHARFFPCRFIIYTAGVKFVTNAGYFQKISAQERSNRNPMISKSLTTSKSIEKKPQTIDECLATFEKWPRNAPIPAESLAAAGFYYLGEELRVKCFMCDLEVNDWHYGMTAISTHRELKSDCQVLLALDSIISSNIDTVNEKWRLETLLSLPFSETNTNDPNQYKNDQRLCSELAACGFYRVKNTKLIRCAYCDVTIEPKLGQSIMSQHRYLTKQSIKKKTTTTITNNQYKGPIVDCLIVRAQCPANIVIPHRKSFPEYPEYQSIFDRIKSFNDSKQLQRAGDYSIRDKAEAGFFLDKQGRMRCFLCGNAILISDKIRREKYSQYNMAQLHAHFYPTCEWVKEILGVKYIAQVLYDQKTSWSSSNTECTYISDGFEDLSDDEDLETIAKPSTTFVSKNIPLSPSPAPSASLQSPSVPASPNEPLTTFGAEDCSDPVTGNGHSQLTSAIISKINPFERIQQEQTKLPHTEDSGSPEISSSIVHVSSISSPVDVRSVLAYESNRLDTFTEHNRETFAQVPVAHLAYVGFFLNAEGTAIQCPWCEVCLTEKQYEDIVRTRPTIVGSVLSNEPWTPMRVHRYANAIMMNRTRPWCTWVRREVGGLYSNVKILKNQLLYPEYPSYSSIEKRIKSFTSDWSYPSGTLLSNQMMAEAGFFYLGQDTVCCYYCGNLLQDFEPRDCPFDEHATFYPRCDFIQNVRGPDYVNQIISECERIPQGRFKIEVRGEQIIKRIIYDKSRATQRKTGRAPVNRKSLFPSRSFSLDIASSELTDDACLLCDANPATHAYDPCQHSPMCEECSGRLNEEQLRKCIVCSQPATIRLRVLIEPRTS